MDRQGKSGVGLGAQRKSVLDYLDVRGGSKIGLGARGAENEICGKIIVFNQFLEIVSSFYTIATRQYQLIERIGARPAETPKRPSMDGLDLG